MTRAPRTEVIDNERRPLGDLLSSELSGADEFIAMSAFLSSDGLSVIEDRLRRILSDEGRVNIVHGADFRITDPAAILTLTKLKTNFDATMSYFVHMDWSLMRNHRFHPNLYAATPDYESYCVVVGSSNLTRGGLYDNTEVNVVTWGGRNDASVRQCLDIWESIRRRVKLLEPDLGFVEKYAILYERAKRIPPERAPPPDLAGLYAELEALQRPVEVRVPRTQLDYVALAIANLTRHDSQRHAPLRDIYAEAERLARSAGQRYDWATFPNSARGRINENVSGRGRGLFARRGGPSGRYGEYRLSERGGRYAERLSG